VKLLLLVGVAGWAAALQAPRGPSADSEAHNPTVRVFGSLRAMMHEGQTGAQVSLGSLDDSPFLFGLGAMADLAGEVLILDGELVVAHPGGRVEALSQQTEAAAALLVVAEVEAWESIALRDSIAWEDLDAALERLLLDSGRDAQQRLPFQILGTFPDLAWHVVDGTRLSGASSSHEDHLRAADRFSARQVEARLLGFYSANDQGVFTHAGSRTHVHCLLEEPRRMGHVDRATVPAGARLLLPRWDEPQATGLAARLLEFLGTAKARDAVESLSTHAECSGPGGEFRTRVSSARPHFAYFEQESERGTTRLWSLPERTWTRNQQGDTEPLPDAVRAFVRGHEFHLHLVEFLQRFAGYRLVGTERVGAGTGTRLDMRDETGHPAAVWVDPVSGRPLQLELNPPGAQGAIRITYETWEEIDGVRWFRDFVLTEGEDRVFRYHYTSIVPNDKPDAFLIPPADGP
jgi:acetolactate decarboxylase